MGDLFFIMRMLVYTFFFVIFMQIKVGPTTIEQKVIHWTHQSQMAGLLQGVAQGAAQFIGVQYRDLTGQMNSKYLKKYIGDQKPGHRLKAKWLEIKKDIDDQWLEKEPESHSDSVLEPGRDSSDL